MKSGIVLITIGAVTLLDATWWLEVAVASGVALFAVYHHAAQAHSPYREGWY